MLFSYFACLLIENQSSFKDLFALFSWYFHQYLVLSVLCAQPQRPGKERIRNTKMSKAKTLSSGGAHMDGDVLTEARGLCGIPGWREKSCNGEPMTGGLLPLLAGRETAGFYVVEGCGGK